MGANDADLEERIIQHLAAAAAMGRARHIRREGQRNRSSAQGRQQFLVFSTHPNTAPTVVDSSSPTHRTEGEPTSAIRIATPSSPPAALEEDSSQLNSQLVSSQADNISPSAPRSGAPASSQHGTPINNRYLHLFSC